MTAPFTKKHLENLNAALYDLSAVLPLLQKAESAGMDVAEVKTMLHDAQERLMKIKQVFFPAPGA